MQENRIKSTRTFDKKDKLEKLIANILNGENYSKVKQFVKENIKAILSDNKKLVSISFVALLETLKNDPEMVKIIQNIQKREGWEHKDNNNIVKYLQSNKDSILDLAEKNYENLVEAFTNNAIDNASNATSSDLTLSLPSSSTFQTHLIRHLQNRRRGMFS